MATTSPFSSAAPPPNLFTDHRPQAGERSKGSPLLGLAPELQLVIISHLPWPDLLALRHSHPYFYHNMPTTVRQRVAWLLSRGHCGLGLPQGRVNMKTDADFCRSDEIRAFLERRRWHLDCRGKGKRCLVIEGHACPAKVMGVGKAFKVMTMRERRLWLGGGRLSPSPLAMSWLLVLAVAVLVALMFQRVASNHNPDALILTNI